MMRRPLPRMAICRVDVRLLLAALRLPADVQVHDVRMSFGRDGCVEFKVEHAALRELRDEYEQLPYVVATIHTVDGFAGWRE